MKRLLVCEDCKIKKLKQIGIKMKVGIGYFAVGQCEICGSNNRHLWEYAEEKVVSG